jgi:glycosyltransferase involved in cell wall biosynthesis
MKVAIDATPLTLSSGGITRYTAELSKALAVSFPEDEVVLVSDQPFPMPSPAPVNLRCGNGPRRPWESRWWLYGLPREMLRQRTDVFHGTHFLVPWLPLWPSVVTMHDLSPWMEPGWHCHAELVRRRAPVLIKLGIATMVVTPSETVRRQVIERFGIHPGRIVSVPLAASPHFRPVPQTRSSTRYFLFVGTLEPRKNLETLAEAWRAVRKDHEVDLVLAGRSRSDAPSLTSEPGLRILGEVDERDLPALYSSALACVYPSLYEGFGLPVLEAMQCGTAVLTSRDPAIRELAGGAAVQVEARDTKAWVEAMTAAVTQPDRLGTWREKALERAKSFSWDRTAALTREVYTEAIRRSEGER